ncbi:CHASE2 domain-containing protein [Stappia sp. ES.058]|uniref:CHASE2 domain-containing protein n=1 Tax=Stappia sp. ES.058 TaxID=1881061 RepID=UPI001AD938C1|nr:adenylate/guanylate cyclase domain-containing protein [Stappia sp. ES.058]
MRMNRRKHLAVAGVAGAFLLLVTLLRAMDPAFVETIRLMGFDTYQRLWPRAENDYPVRIVDIDERSLAIHGQWPWRRDTLADLTDALAEMGAAVVAYDVIFAEPDRLSPHRYLPELEETSELKAQALPDTDAEFAEAIARMPVVLGYALRSDDNGGTPQSKAGFAYVGSNPIAGLPAFPSALKSLDMLEARAAGSGSLSLSARDTSGIVRRIPMLVTNGEALYPSLSMEALRVAQGASSYIVRSADASGEIAAGGAAVTEVKVGAIPFPTTALGELWVYFNADREDRYISAADVLDRDKRASVQPEVEGRIIYIGTSAIGLFDIRTTPLGELVPGVSVHAQATEQILSGDFLSRPDWSYGAEIIATFLLGLIVIALVLAFGAGWAALIGGGVAAALYAGAAHLFLTKGLLLDPVYPTAANLFVYAAATALLYVLTEREKQFVRTAFGQYLAPEMVRRLENAPDSLKLGGEMRDMTILFMDVRGFTPISEQLTPTEVVAFLNALLSPLSEEIQRHGGTIDKYIGDSIMAFWNAPMEVEDHARKAAQAALAMLRVVDDLNESDAFGFKARNMPKTTVQIGVGLNSGQACVGNMGSNRRFNYSVIGDAVNIAARIESSCKAVGADCVVSQATALAAPDFAMLDAGAIPLKGKSVPISLFALAGDPDYAATPAFADLSSAHARMMRAVATEDASAARTALDACRACAPAHLAAFYDRLEERIEAMAPVLAR